MAFFTVEKIARQLPLLREAIYRDAQEIRHFKLWEADLPGAEMPDFDDRAWIDFTSGDFWGGYDITAWFRTRLSIPESWPKSGKVALRFRIGPRDGGGSTAETLLYINGQPLQALDVWHEEVWLPPELQTSEIAIALKAWSGVLAVPARRRFTEARLVWIDPAAEQFYYETQALYQAVLTLDAENLHRVQLLQALDRALRQVDFTHPRSPAFYRSLETAAGVLKEKLLTLEAFEEIKPKVIGIGHSHIDMAWLWRLSHTRQKAIRTFTTVLHLMRQYPEYHYLHSSPQLYKFIKEDAPELYARIREQIAAGRWEATGGMWVEADTNLPSGESLIRQFLLGNAYLQTEFGRRARVLWLPDVFGYSGALPQIAKKCGCDYLMTTKISWNQFNRFPYDTFNWRGIDGTELLTHFVTTPETGSVRYTYNGNLIPADVKGLWDNYRQKELNTELLLPFGWGDGGGGPTREMLENARALKNLPGLPRVEQGSAEAFFARLETRLQGQELPIWDGELYLEYHRGVYTSQAAVKRANRQAETLYHHAEWLACLAGQLTGMEYPQTTLQNGWEKLLLNQFHDILPGSSIREVYEDSRRDHEAIREIGTAVLNAARDALTAKLPAAGPALALFNGLGWERGGLIALPWTPTLTGLTVPDAAGNPTPVQEITEEGKSHLLFSLSGIPALGYRVVSLVPAPSSPPPSPLTVAPGRIETPFYQIALNAAGQIVALIDKRDKRQLLAPGSRGNVFQTFNDRPMDFDAWDIDIYYQEKMEEIDTLVESVVEENGPLRGVLCQRWQFYNSTITQRLTVYADSPRVDFQTEVDWHEQQILLKVAFPVDVRATRATYEIQFGALERPTHRNTSWDHARFESVGHRWIDLSEGNNGVALLNDCKYGHDVHDNVMRLTLIKSAIEPDPTADQGIHRFTYSLLPHRGDWRTADVIPQAADLNNPLLCKLIESAQPGRLPAQFSFARVDAEHVVIETLKKAEADNAWVVRVYDARQYRNPAVHLTFGHPILYAVECNLVEEGAAVVEYHHDTLTFPIAPYEIKTFKVWFKEEVDSSK